MLAQELIIKKRDGFELSEKEISWFISSMCGKNLSEGQVAAFAMAVFFKGMNLKERMSLTKAMRDSGDVIKWDLPGVIVDKHSTGGVGDTVSLLLAPALAACGCFVPMISGRGLGHTGGTLDKFESIEGYNVYPSKLELKKVVKEVGCAIVGQTEELAPADKTLYSIRDVTGTIESLDLITASILSKKLSANLDSLVLDIKVGNGSFMKTLNEAKNLASSLVKVANGLGCRTTAILTDMSEPLCSNVGNALEVQSVVDFLLGDNREKRLSQVVNSLGGTILYNVGVVSTLEEGEAKIQEVFRCGDAAEIFSKMIKRLGGPSDFLTHANKYLPRAPLVEDVFSGDRGYIASIDARSVGISLIELGGGRKRSSDNINYAVGFENFLKVGTYVDGIQPLARIHAQNKDIMEKTKVKIKNAFKIEQEPIQKTNLILGQVV